ncbi:MAG: glycosyltransferase family 39 protein [Cytophagaceae bacterium]|nr:glycosyltransferase family 39 protein [Cytophagaceae bacterium]
MPKLKLPVLPESLPKVISLLNLSRNEMWFLVAYITFSILGMTLTPLFDEDEGFFAEAARNMLATGDWISIKVNGEYRYDKPALFFWFEVLFLKIIGNREIAVRLPSFIAFIANVLVMRQWARQLFSNQAGYKILIVLSTFLQFQILARAAVSDNFLNLFVSLALFSFWKRYQKHTLSMLPAFVFAGLGFFIKGPIAFVLIFGIIFSFLILKKEWRLIRSYLNPFYWLVAILIPAPWFYFAFQKSGEFLFTDFFLKHNFGRFAHTMESHGGSLFYYIPVLILFIIPFTHTLIFLAIKTLKYFVSNKSFNPLKTNDLEPHKLLFLLWFMIPFILFSISKTQLPHYISISYFPLALIFSNQKQLFDKFFFFQITGLILLLIFVPVVYESFKIEDRFVNEMLIQTKDVFGSRYLSVMISIISGLAFLFFYKKSSPFIPALVFGLGLSWFIFHFSILQQGFVKALGQKLYKSNINVKMKDHYNPSLSFYAQKGFPIAGPAQTGDLIFSKSSQSDTSEVIGAFGGYRVVRVRE